ncbi:DUF4157 domain-containing protein [Yoonia sp.]|uniref:eCIS core domain-containing protein n=1 Tax=Yoonia sp. TaxID=2212373 RepID=UPI0025F2BD04|nr:DUF4157 domain-containing protein [Yoonia sp.]
MQKFQQAPHQLTPNTRKIRPRDSALQQAADHSTRSETLQALQRMANTSPTVRMLHSVPTIQLVEAKAARANDTGLPDGLKSGIESLSGMSMDGVKVHRNSDKPAQVGAHAYAQGTNIHLAPGQEQHLPHEAWHVVQQAQGRVKPTVQMKGVAINDDAGLENEADVMGAKALQLSSSINIQSLGQKPISWTKSALVQRLTGAAGEGGGDHVLPGTTDSRRSAALEIAKFLNQRARALPGGGHADTSVLAANNPGNIYVRSNYTLAGVAAHLETWSEMTGVGGGYVKRVRINEGGAVVMDRVMNDPAPTALNTALAANAGGGGGHQYAPMHGVDGGDGGSLDISNTNDRTADNVTKVVGEGARFGWLAKGLSNGSIGNASIAIFNVSINIPQAGKLSMNPTFQQLWGAWRSGFGRSYLKDKSAAKTLLQARVRERFRPAQDGDAVGPGSIADGGVAGGLVTSLQTKSGDVILVPINVGGISGAGILSDFAMTWTADH